MKKNPFSRQYPYIAYWVENHGYLQLGIDDDSPIDAFLLLVDAGGNCYEDEDSESIDEAFQKAEKYLREVEFPDRFDQETIDALEEDYTKYKLNIQ